MKLLRSSVLIVVPHRLFNDTEFNVVASALQAEGCRIRYAAASIQPALGVEGTTVQPQLLFSDVDARQFDAVVFIGGGGARDFWSHPRAHNLVRAFESHGKLLAAICLAPVTLARAGILKDKTVACHPSARRDLEQAGAKYSSEPVVLTDKVLTANGPESAQVFAETLIGLLAPSSNG